MNEENMEVVMEDEWSEGEDVGAEDAELTQDTPEEADREEAPSGNPPEPQPPLPPARPDLPPIPKGLPGQVHPLLRRAQENARRQDMERFLAVYPQVKSTDIPRQVWEQVSRGVPLVSAYAFYENRQLRLQLNAERQNALNRQRTPGGLGANAGGELDEMDRLWGEED